MAARKSEYGHWMTSKGLDENQQKIIMQSVDALLDAKDKSASDKHLKNVTIAREKLESVTERETRGMDNWFFVLQASINDLEDVERDLTKHIERVASLPRGCYAFARQRQRAHLERAQRVFDARSGHGRRWTDSHGLLVLIRGGDR